MTVNGILTALLKPEYISRGYGLREDEDFLYVLRAGKVIATFNARSNSLDSVNRFIEKDVNDAEN